MKRTAQSSADSATADVALAGQGWQLRTKLTVPRGPTQLRTLLPMVQALTNQVVDMAQKAAEDKGEKVSCKKGCGACCRQLVPIAEVEARQIADLVRAFPEPRRTQVLARFAEARRRLEQAGILDKLSYPERWAEGEGRALGLTYFFLGIPCPFLEEESCSIHRDRPIACREYLVTTPAENCARPSAETVRCVQKARSIRTVLLILALDWAESHPEEPPARPGPEWVHGLIENLTRKDISFAGP